MVEMWLLSEVLQVLIELTLLCLVVSLMKSELRCQAWVTLIVSQKLCRHFITSSQLTPMR